MPFRFCRGAALVAILSAFPAITVLAPSLAWSAESVDIEHGANAIPDLHGGVAQNADSPNTDSPVEKEISLSPEEVISLAQTLLNQGQLDASEQIYRSLLQSPIEDVRIEAAFQIGQIHMYWGRYREAIHYFVDILNHKPDLPRVRLDLARAHYLDGNPVDARFQFELLKGGELPPEVIANIDRFLDAIRRTKKWTGNFSLAPVSDSNITQASGDKEECIDTFIGTLCRPLDKKTSGMGLSLNTAFDYFHRFNQDWGLRASIGFYGLEYKGRDFDYYASSAALGPRYLWDSGEASLQPTFRKRWYAGREYNSDYGLRLDGQEILGRLILNAGASYSTVKYDDSYLNDIFRGSSWSLRLQPRYILNDRTFIQIGLDFTREDTRDSAYGSDSRGYSAGIYRILPYGFSVYLEGSFTQADYHGRQWYVTKGNMIDERTRKDRIQGLLISLSSTRLEEKYHLMPTLQYSYTKRDSNIWSRKYERNYVNLMFSLKI